MMSLIFFMLFLFLLFLLGGSFFGLLLVLECLSLVFLFSFSFYLSYSGFIYCLSLIVLSALFGLVIMVSNVGGFNSTNIFSFLC